ncbi:hypothetical protein F2Q68_00007687 [Brassica cretica]|uniref:Uncharacterized protein n=1 Tax=Brassica cretica TaxID=69181 RepID=A0A8S9L147_BRACR|nr:hypothetical protein F2Q68_00007687 [Brassica cretica]
MPPLDFARLIRRLALLATAGRVSLVFVFILIYWLKLFCRSDGAFCLSVPFSSESGDGLESNSLEHGSCLLKLWEVGRWTSMASNLIKMEANDYYRDDFNFGYDHKRKSSQISMMVFGLGSSLKPRHDRAVFLRSVGSWLGAIFVFVFLVVRLWYGIY